MNNEPVDPPHDMELEPIDSFDPQRKETDDQWARRRIATYDWMKFLIAMALIFAFCFMTTVLCQQSMSVLDRWEDSNDKWLKRLQENNTEHQLRIHEMRESWTVVNNERSKVIDERNKLKEKFKEFEEANKHQEKLLVRWYKIQDELNKDPDVKKKFERLFNEIK